MDKLTTLLNRGGGPGGDTTARDDVPVMLRYAARLCGAIGGAMAIFFGLYMCLQILLVQTGCLLGGIWQMIAGFLIIICEAPCCCFFVDFVRAFSDKMENRPLWNKAIAYVGISIPPFLMCFGFGSIFGSGPIFATGVLYGMMVIGKKGSRDDMAAVAAGGSTPPGAPMSADHNVTLMEDPDVWRPN